MATGTEFLLEIQQRLTGASVVTELQKTEEAVVSAKKRFAELEASSVQTTKGLEKVASQLEGVRSKMASAMAAGDEKAFWRLSGAAAELAKKQELLATKATQTKAALDAEGKTISGLAERAEALKKSQGASVDIEKTAGGLKKLGGPLGRVSNTVEDLSEGWGALSAELGTTGAMVAAGAAALAALAVAIVAVGAAMVAGAAAALKWGVGLADANRTQRLLADGIAGTVEGGRELDSAIAALQDRVPQTRDELLGMASDLAKTGLRGAELSSALEEAATKAARLKWGPDFAKQMLSLDNQAERLQRNLAGTFGGLNIEPILDGMAKLVALFDQNTASGQAMKVLFEAIFQPLIDAAPEAFVLVERGFLMMEIAALRAGIAFREATAGIDVGPFVALWNIVREPVFDFLAGSVQAAIYTLEGFAIITAHGIDQINQLVAAVQSVGPAVLDGLLGPLQQGARLAFGTGWELGDSIARGAKEALGIASPSKVFEEIGGYTAEGFAGGVDDGAATASSALERMVTPPAAGGGSGGGASIDLSGATFVFQGVANAEEAGDVWVRKLEELLSGTGEQTGALA